MLQAEAEREGSEQKASQLLMLQVEKARDKRSLDRTASSPRTGGARGSSISLDFGPGTVQTPPALHGDLPFPQALPPPIPSSRSSINQARSAQHRPRFPSLLRQMPFLRHPHKGSTVRRDNRPCLRHKSSLSFYLRAFQPGTAAPEQGQPSAPLQVAASWPERAGNCRALRAPPA